MTLLAYIKSLFRPKTDPLVEMIRLRTELRSEYTILFWASQKARRQKKKHSHLLARMREINHELMRMEQGKCQ